MAWHYNSLIYKTIMSGRNMRALAAEGGEPGGGCGGGRAA